MKTIRHNERARDKLLHVEAELCVVNIRTGLWDTEGRRVTAIEILPDPGCFAPASHIRVIEQEGDQ